MSSEIEYLDSVKTIPSIFSRLLYRWFGIETSEYKKWWKYYCDCVDMMLKTHKIHK